MAVEQAVEAKLPVLTIDGGPNDGETLPIVKPVTTLGRGDENDIVIRGPGVSRNHAEVTISGMDVILRDLKSTNGTHVNGVDVSGTQHSLRHSDEIRLGSSKVSVVYRSDEASTVRMRVPSPAARDMGPRTGATQKAVRPRERIISYLESHPEGTDWEVLEAEAGLSGQLVRNLIAAMMRDGKIRKEGQSFFAARGPRNFCREHGLSKDMRLEGQSSSRTSPLVRGARRSFWTSRNRRAP